MAADLAAVPFDGSGGRPLLIVITTGELEANRQLVAQHGIKCLVLLQNQMEISGQYRAQGTPMGYRIDAAGRIASELAVGAEKLLQLAAGRRPGPSALRAADNNSAHTTKQPDPSLSRSRLNRNGLKAGAAAPEFQLPRIDGGELSLADCAVHARLLVFSDPDCGPCDDLAPRCRRCTCAAVRPAGRDGQPARHRMPTRAKADKLGLTFPIVMQKQWEMSLKYGMFATPIGYLIDEQGVLVRDVAVGVEPILSLTSRSQSVAAQGDSGERCRRSTPWPDNCTARPALTRPFRCAADSSIPNHLEHNRSSHVPTL